MSVKRYSIGVDGVDPNGNLVKYTDYAALEDRCAALAAEISTANERLQRLVQIINNADNSYCMCGEAMETHAHGGCGHPTGMFDYHYGKWLESANQIPATDAFLAEVRNEAGARAVELFAQTLGSPYAVRDEKCYEDGFTRAIEIVRGAQAPRFAAQLRKGVQS